MRIMIDLANVGENYEVIISGYELYEKPRLGGRGFYKELTAEKAKIIEWIHQSIDEIILKEAK